MQMLRFVKNLFCGWGDYAQRVRGRLPVFTEMQGVHVLAMRVSSGVATK
jgi:hypothetical protein